ncbi:MAG: hypothetical protein M5U33_11175 [Pseudorhodoplanes sp.]|nr:hypothetical protein [Pseudorhodoplanes sp.]
MMATVQEAIRRLSINSAEAREYWYWEIKAAKNGDVAPLIIALRSDKPISPRGERSLREAIAALLAGEFKRRRGRPPVYRRYMPEWLRLSYRDPALFLATEYVRRYKRVQAVRYGRKRGVEPEAIEKAAGHYGVESNAIHNWMHRSRQPRRAKNKRT